MVPLRSGYPFFSQNTFIEPRLVHTCLWGLVGVPRAPRATAAPDCAAWGRFPSKNAWVLVNRLRFSSIVLNLTRADDQDVKFNIRVSQHCSRVKFNTVRVKFNTDGSIQVATFSALACSCLSVCLAGRCGLPPFVLCPCGLWSRLRMLAAVGIEPVVLIAVLRSAMVVARHLQR